MDELNRWLARLEKYTDRWWYFPFMGFLAGADFFIAVVPTDGLLVSSVLVRSRYWMRAAFWFTLGSALGSWAIAAVVQTWGTGLVDWVFGAEIWQSSSWVYAKDMLAKHGWWSLFLMAAGPLPMVPFSIVAGIGGMPLTQVLVVSLVGRGVKYVTFSAVAAFAPHLLRKWFKKPREEAKEILEKRRDIPGLGPH
jgi:membrane protein YqaA with SNARE-associated domain